LEIAVIGGGAKLQFLDLDQLLLLLGRLGLLLLFELELAVIHDPANRRLGVGLDLDQVESRIHGHLQRFVALQHANVLAFGVDYAHPRNTDLGVLAISLIGTDSRFLQPVKNAAPGILSGTARNDPAHDEPSSLAVAAQAAPRAILARVRR